MGKACGEAGHSDMLYNRVANFASRLSDQDRDTCCLIYDEINTVGDLAFKIINGEYVFYGLVSESIRRTLFIPKPQKPLGHSSLRPWGHQHWVYTSLGRPAPLPHPSYQV